MNFDFSKLMKQAQEMQNELKTSQEDLSKHLIAAESGGGIVRIKANAKPQILDIEIETSLLKLSEKEMLEDLLTAAINTVLEKAKNESAEIIRNKTGEMMSKLNITDLSKDK